jgi:hypothetical protein
VDRFAQVAVIALVMTGALVGGCSAPPSPGTMKSENVASAALLEECAELTRLTENLMGMDGKMVGKSLTSLRDIRGDLFTSHRFVKEIVLKKGLNSIEMDQLQTLATGMWSLGMTARGTPVSTEMIDIGAYWIDEGVDSVRMWCP